MATPSALDYLVTDQPRKGAKTKTARVARPAKGRARSRGELARLNAVRKETTEFLRLLDKARKRYA